MGLTNQTKVLKKKVYIHVTWEMVKRLQLVNVYFFITWYFVVLMIWPEIKTEIISNICIFINYPMPFSV